MQVFAVYDGLNQQSAADWFLPTNFSALVGNPAFIVIEEAFS
jgi:hypothetical protein